MNIDALQHSFEEQGVMPACAELIGAKLMGSRFDAEVRAKEFWIRIGVTTKKPGKTPTEFAHRIGIYGTHQEAIDGFLAAFKAHNGVE